MSRFSRVALTTAIVALTTGMALSAHHSVRAVYDTERIVRLSGTIRQVDLTNPHVRVHLEVAAARGEVTTWLVEMAPPNALRRKLDLHLIDVGSKVGFEAWVRKDGKQEATGRTLLTIAGGRFDVGDSMNWFSLPNRLNDVR